MSFEKRIMKIMPVENATIEAFDFVTISSWAIVVTQIETDDDDGVIFAPHAISWIDVGEGKVLPIMVPLHAAYDDPFTAIINTVETASYVLGENVAAEVDLLDGEGKVLQTFDIQEVMQEYYEDTQIDSAIEEKKVSVVH
jgi:hypothetical protein